MFIHRFVQNFVGYQNIKSVFEERNFFLQDFSKYRVLLFTQNLCDTINIVEKFFY